VTRLGEPEDKLCGSAVTKVTVPTIAERNASGCGDGSQEREFGHPERVRSSNYRDQLD